jgi:hypothetical protein
MSETKEKKLYIRLFHGRKAIDEELNDWGEDGPVLGPLKWVHTTYATTLHICNEGELDGGVIDTYEGMVYYNGMYYGDWSVFITDNPTGWDYDEDDTHPQPFNERLTNPELDPTKDLMGLDKAQ